MPSNSTKSSRFQVCLLAIAAAFAFLVPGLVSQAQAQDFPFFIQPMSVDDLRDLADDLELSREQQAALMPLYERYHNEYERLQETEVAELLDRGIAMSQTINFWGGEFTIPPRKEIEEIIEQGIDIYDGFNRIDTTFFDGVNTLIIEEQLPQLERARRRRRLTNMVIPHFAIASQMNRGIRFNMIEWVERQELEPEQKAAILAITDDFESRLIRLAERFQDDIEDIAESVLDLVDDMGLRDMNLQELMALQQDQDLEGMLKGFFDEQSKAIQKTSEKMSRLNLQTAQQVKEILTPEQWVQLTFDYSDRAYGRVTGGVETANARFNRAIKLEGVVESQQESLRQAQAEYQSRWIALFPVAADALEDQRAYRTSEQLEGDVPGEHDDRVDRIEERVDQLVDGVNVTVAGILTPEQLALLDGDAGDDRKAEAARPRRGGEGGSSTSTGRTYSLPISAMEPASVDQFSSWLGLEDVDEFVLESLYDEYMMNYERISDEYDQKITAGYEAIEGENTWRERRQVRRAIRDEMLPQLKEAEDAFFADMTVALPADTEPQLLEQIRISHDRARRREKIWNGNWSLRGQTEGAIDIGEIVLAIDPGTLDEETRKLMIDVMISYNATSTSDIDSMEQSYDKVKSLESRLWGDDSDELKPDIRQLLRERWEKGRSEMSEVAARMSTTNRSTYEGILRQMPEEHANSVRDLYERKAYPDVFKDSGTANEQIEAALAIENLNPDQREFINDLALDYRTDYRSLTDSILELTRSQQGTQRAWPPSADSMKGYLRLEQIRYRRRQLNDRTRILIELQLTEQQLAQVPGLGFDAPGEESDS